MRKPLQALADLAEIRSGYTFRARVQDDPLGDVSVLQIKDLKGHGDGFPKELPRIRWEGAGAPPVLAAGDIVLPGRGEYHEAVMADGKVPVIATSQMFVLRVQGRAVTPQYLCWYLNQPQAGAYFRAHLTGSNMPMLTKQALAAMPVPVPPLETQHKIIALQRLWERERDLTQRLLHNRETLFKGIFQHLLEH